MRKNIQFNRTLDKIIEFSRKVLEKLDGIRRTIEFAHRFKDEITFFFSLSRKIRRKYLISSRNTFP